jgi:hypothetical protein
MIENHLVNIGYVNSPLEAVTHPDLPSWGVLKENQMYGNRAYLTDARGEKLAREFMSQTQLLDGDLALLLLGENHTLAVGSKLSSIYNPFFHHYSQHTPPDINKLGFARYLFWASPVYPIDKITKRNPALIVGEIHMLDFEIPFPDIDILKSAKIKRVIFGIENHTTADARKEKWLINYSNCERISRFASDLRNSLIGVEFVGLDNNKK